MNPYDPGSPTSHVMEQECQYVVSVELSDWKPEDVTITYFPGMVMVEGNAREWAIRKGCGRSDSKGNVPQSFALSFTLPGQIELDKAAAEFNNNLLSITLPKSEVVKSYQIKITTNKGNTRS